MNEIKKIKPQIITLIILILSSTLILSIIPMVNAPDNTGNIMVQFGNQLWVNGAPTSDAVRIRDAYIAYGQPKYVFLSNLANEKNGVGYNNMPEALITWFHEAGVKCGIWCHTYDSVAHTYFDFNTLKAQVDAQMAWGPSIDIINFDECSTKTASGIITESYIENIGNYVHSKGVLFSINTGERDIPDSYCHVPDFIMMEGSWWAFSQNGGIGKTDLYTHSINLIETYPTKFWGITGDYYVEYYLNVAPWVIPPNSKTPIDLEELTRLTFLAWNNGIYNFEFVQGNWFEELPDWWEDWLAAVSTNTPTPTPNGGGGGGGGSGVIPTPTASQTPTPNSSSSMPLILIGGVALLLLTSSDKKKRRRRR